MTCKSLLKLPPKKRTSPAKLIEIADLGNSAAHQLTMSPTTSEIGYPINLASCPYLLYGSTTMPHEANGHI